MKKILLLTIVLLPLVINAQKVIHVKGVSTLDVQGGVNNYGINASIGGGKYIRNNIFVGGSLAGEKFQKGFTLGYEAHAIPRMDYVITNFGGLYINASAGIPIGFERVQSTSTKAVKSAFSLAAYPGINLEYWSNSYVAVNLGFNQWVRILGVKYPDGSKNHVRHKYELFIGLKINLS